MIVYKFVNWEIGEKRGDIDFNYIKKEYNNKFGGAISNLLADGVLKLGGWAYDFRDELKKFLIKQYGVWREIYAPNKTLARKAIFGRIEQIIEI